ncbi:MAG: hypothetical protein MI755_16445 [Sphingomonadales bacterium]|nr:hypothetical protein [Sphingomonadales bacterium]
MTETRITDAERAILADGYWRWKFGSAREQGVLCRRAKLRVAQNLEKKGLGTVYPDQSGYGGWFTINEAGRTEVISAK